MVMSTIWYKLVMAKSFSQFYVWASFVLQFVFPFVSLLMMNSVIIHTLRNRIKNVKIEEGQGQGQGTRMKSSEKQVFAILLLVTFALLILSTPMYVFFLLNLIIDFSVSPKLFAIQHLCSNGAQKLHFTNHGRNFFFYVVSGQKFRTDLIKLFKRQAKGRKLNVNSISYDTESRQGTIEKAYTDK